MKSKGIRLRSVVMVVTMMLFFVLLHSVEANASKTYGIDIQSAGTIAYGREYQASIDKSEGSKEHWYQFTTKVSDDYYYSLQFNKLVRKDSMNVQVLDSQGKAVMTANSSSSSVQKRLKPDTTYYIKVYCPSSLSDDNYYGFTLDVIYDPETDNMADASIYLSQGNAYEGTIACYYEEDWMTFKAVADKTTITSSKKDSGWALWTSIYDVNGKQLKTFTTSKYTESITFDTTAGKLYYVKIQSNADAGEEKDMSYSVLLVGDADEKQDEKAEEKQEDKNSQKTDNKTENQQTSKDYGIDVQSAVSIEFGREYQARINKNEGSKEHWYQFRTKSADDYYYDLVFNKLVKKDSLIVQVLDSQGNKIMAAGGSTTRIQKRLKPGTTYYINVYCTSSLSDDNYYGFTLNTVADKETDDMSDASIKLTVGKTYNGSMACYYEVDWLVFKATGDKTTLTASKKDNGWSLWTYIYDSNGKQLKTQTTGQFSNSMTVDTKAGKVYYIKVSGNPDLGEEKDMRYSIKLTDPRVNITKCTIRVKNMKYNGQLRKAPVTVTYKGVTLKKNVDYTLKYSNNRKIGKAKVTITGKGDYKGKVTKTFKIVR